MPGLSLDQLRRVLRLHRALRLRRRDDRGAVAVLVTILLASGVLLGMGALVIDVGNLYAERGQLQSGADAAAFKVAQDCALDSSACTPGNAAADAAGYANANASDGVSGVSVVCGRGGSLNSCPAPAAGLVDCVNPAPGTGNYVEVRTQTQQSDGTTVLPPAFAQSLVSGYSGSTVQACARAAWGPPASARLSITQSICEWNGYTNNGASFPNPAVDRVIRLRGSSGVGTCQPGGGPTIPEGYSWLRDTSGTCRTPVSVGGSYRIRTNNSPSSACRSLLNALRDSGEPVLMPIYDQVTGSGSGTRFRIMGIAAFVVTGWNLPGFVSSSTLTGTDYCDTAALRGTCIYGYYTQTLVPGTATIGGPELGANVVALIG